MRTTSITQARRERWYCNHIPLIESWPNPHWYLKWKTLRWSLILKGGICRKSFWRSGARNASVVPGNTKADLAKLRFWSFSKHPLTHYLSYIDSSYYVKYIAATSTVKLIGQKSKSQYKTLPKLVKHKSKVSALAVRKFSPQISMLNPTN